MDNSFLLKRAYTERGPVAFGHLATKELTYMPQNMR
jgi:hypothetical protein